MRRGEGENDKPEKKLDKLRSYFSKEQILFFQDCNNSSWFSISDNPSNNYVFNNLKIPLKTPTFLKQLSI